MSRALAISAREISVDIPPIVGWNDSTPLVKAYKNADSLTELWTESKWLVIKNIFDWMITAIALSLGSPFWFDSATIKGKTGSQTYKIPGR
ncbi:hypothetical protein [Sessilibacter sp. MAH4]